MYVEINERYLSGEKVLPFLLCSIGATEKQGDILRPAGYRHHHVLWVTGGEGLFQVAGEGFTLSAGEGLFLSRDVPHSYRSAGSRFATAWVSYLGADSALDHYRIGAHRCFRVPPRLAAAHRELWGFCQGNSTVFSRSAAGYSWLVDCLEAVFEPQPGQVVRRYLEAHFGEPLTLEEIAEQVHMTRFALCHYYKKEVGISVMEQLKQIRLAKARQLLRQTALPIEEISRMCGYESPSYFGRLFREAVGCAPRDYRARS